MNENSQDLDEHIIAVIPRALLYAALREIPTAVGQARAKFLPL